MASENDPSNNDVIASTIEKSEQHQDEIQGDDPVEENNSKMLDEEADERVNENEIDEDSKTNNRCGFCMSDRSWTCIFLATVFFGIIVGCIAALIFTQTRIVEYFLPTPDVFPDKTFSIDYLWPGYRYDFYKEKENYADAKKICEFHNTTLLIFHSTQEEKEIDCYMNVRNNAEDRQVIMWINETIIFGGPLMYARLGSFYSENRQEVIRKTNQVLEVNGCDVQKDYSERKAVWTADQENTEKETIYNIAKYYGNHGLRSTKQGSTNGCWNLIRWNEAAERKHSVVCKAIESTEQNSTSLIIPNRKKLFSQTYCNEF